ncbi:MAG TPA: NUDIX domain-containing protein [Coxiellaceae bacterium]|nr:NUDIX domain-containing protein [Coxiellaceae bacterium]
MANALIKGIDYTGICVVYFCHDGHGKFVMAQRNLNARDEHGRWDIGGGAVEFNETIEDTIRQEIKQEYCTDVLDLNFLGFRDVHREHDGRPTHWLALDFKVLVDATMVQNGEPHKFENIGWFTFDTMPANVHSQFPKFLELYKSKLH